MSQTGSENKVTLDGPLLDCTTRFAGHGAQVLGLVSHQFGSIAALKETPGEPMQASPTVGVG